MLIDLLETYIYIDLVMSYLHNREYFLPAGSVTTTYVLTILLENTLMSSFSQYWIFLFYNLQTKPIVYAANLLVTFK